MITPTLKKPLIFSLLGHLTVFGIFSFSFGWRLPRADSSGAFFLGSNLSSAQLTPYLRSNKVKPIYQMRPDTSLLSARLERDKKVGLVYFKPEADLLFNGEKMIPAPKIEPPAFMQNKREPSIMFYPALPYHFLLYFKDRQVAHIELMFNLSSNNGINAVTIKRKISSGNLEADLLAMRYISHYLSIQQKSFPLNTWQSVKIELKAKNDNP